MDKRKSIFQIVCFLVVFVAIIFFLTDFSYPSKVLLGEKYFSVEVVDTKNLLEKGLSGHEPLSVSEGMLFIFQKPDKYGFWMKDMLFPIDIIWMDEKWKIVHIEKSVSPESYPKVFYPEVPTQYVLEIQAGQANILGIRAGETVTFFKK